MMTRENLYSMRGIERRYGDFTLSVSELDVVRGSSLGLSGPNGSGKSTLLRLMAFLEQPDAGRVDFNGSGTRHGATMLQQDPYLLKRSVFDNVTYGLVVCNDRQNLKERCASTLELVNLDPSKFMTRKWFELSGGEAKRVALAARIILKPEALLLDEPVANVDAESSRAIINAVKWLRDEHRVTLIVSSHDMDWLNSVTDSVWKLHDGKPAGAGNSNLFTGPWISDGEGYSYHVLPEGARVYSSFAAEGICTSILHAHDIAISENEIQGSPDVNVLEGKILFLASDELSGRILVDAEVSGRVLRCSITGESAVKMGIIPGKKVSLVFKAASFERN